ncbi:MAG: DUF58 domain-containing protein [Planctomycetaceae bacterium]|nr:DUF58 domain-containing protein [Planctomycetaceae bacterium]
MQQSVLSKYVDPETLNRLAGRGLEPRGLVAGTLAGNHKSPFSGFAVEFASHREYVPGDDPKHIDWRVYFTRDKYFIKQYEMETNLVCHLVLDTSASMRYGEGPRQKLLAAARLATTLGYAVVRQGDKVTLATCDETVIDFVPPGNSMGQIVRMTERLDTLKPTRKTRLPECLLDLCGRFGRRSIVLVFSDFFTDVAKLEKAIERLRYSRHEVVLLQVLHPDELEFHFEGNVKFRGLEVDEQLLTQPAELRKRYLEAISRFNATLEEACLRNKVERVVVDTGRNPAEVLVDYLNARSLRVRGR